MDVFYALAEPRRRKIVELLARKGSLSAGEIYAKFDVTAQAISQHLRVLLDARILSMEKRAQRRIYSINTDSMEELERWANQMETLWNKSLDGLGTLLEEEKKRKKSGEKNEWQERI